MEQGEPLTLYNAGLMTSELSERKLCFGGHFIEWSPNAHGEDRYGTSPQQVVLGFHWPKAGY